MRIFFILFSIFLYFNSIGQVEQGSTIDNKNSPNSISIQGDNNTINAFQDKNESPNIIVNLIIDTIYYYEYDYYYKIENTSNTAAENVTFVASSNDYFSNFNDEKISRSLYKNNPIIYRPNKFKMTVIIKGGDSAQTGPVIPRQSGPHIPR